MSAKKARDKSLLSKQEIAVRRKQLSQKKLESNHSGRRAITGVLVTAASVLAFLAVATFDAQDRVGPGFHNAVGPVGHAIAEALRGLFGVCAFVLPVVGFYAATVLLMGDGEKKRWPQAVSFALLLLCSSVLAQLLFADDGTWAHPPGGLIGREVGGVLTALFSTVGTVVLVSALATVAFIVGTQFAFLKLCAWAWEKTALFGLWARRQVDAWVQQQRQAAEMRRQLREAEELEERAFLDHLEDEEAQLSELEAAATEAEEAEAEAARLVAMTEAERHAKIVEKERQAAERERALVEKEAARLAREALKTARVREKENRAQSVAAIAPTLINHAHADLPIEEGPLAGDPAWAFSLQPQPEAAELVDALSAPPPRRVPTIVANGLPVGGPPPPPADALSLPPMPVVPGPAAPALADALVPPVPLAEALAQAQAFSLPPMAAAALTASTAAPGAAGPGAAAGAVPALGPIGPGGARMPLIVEPKAPPRPTAKKEQKEFELFDGRQHFQTPPITVLEANTHARTALDKDAFLSTAHKLSEKLKDFSIDGEVVEIRPGPVVTMYEFKPAPGVKISKIASLADDLAMAMEAMRVRIVAPIPGKGVVGIEVPNKDRELVFLKEIAEQDAFQKSSSRLTMSLGKDVEGMPYVLNLAKAPHLLIAGTTGSGKSVGVNSMIMSILLKSTPDEVRFLMVDPKTVELSIYDGIPHLLLPVVTDMRKAAVALQWAVDEMERRYKTFADAGVRNISGFNELVEKEVRAAKAVEGQVVKKTKPKQAKAEAPVAEAAPAPAPAAAPLVAPPPEAKKKKRRMLIVDVAPESETTGETAAATAEAAPTPDLGIGVAAPSDNVPEDPREAVEEAAVETLSSEVKAELQEATTEADIRVTEPTGDEEEVEEAVEAAPAEKGKTDQKKMAYIVVIIDELADLMMVAAKEVETSIARLAQKARAAGIHLIVATQRPSVDVVTGVIKANFPTRISFMLRNRTDSSTIIDQPGAEKLLGNGDMLILPPDSPHLVRVHGCFVSEAEIKRACDHLRVQGKPVYDESILKPREEENEGGVEEDDLSDELYDQAVAIVAEMKQVSISMLQRKMRIGYNRSARMIERMEREGIVGAADGAKPREVLIRQLGEMPGAGAF